VAGFLYWRKNLFRKLMLLPAVMGLVLVGPSTLSAADNSLPLEQRMQRLERRIGSLSELIMQVDALKRENSELRGQVELQNHKIESLKKRQRDLYIDIDQRLSGINAQPAAASQQPASVASTAMQATPTVASQPITSAPVSAQPVKPAVTQSPASSVSEQERGQYNAAFKLLSPAEKRYPEAIKAFQAFLQQYPESALADNAQYWLAEANYVSQQNDQALLEFEKVITLYPNSSKVSGALLKIGYLQHSAGQIDQATQTLNKVIVQHPATAAANMAKNRLQRIQSQN